MKLSAIFFAFLLPLLIQAVPAAEPAESDEAAAAVDCVIWSFEQPIFACPHRDTCPVVDTLGPINTHVGVFCKQLEGSPGGITWFKIGLNRWVDSWVFRQCTGKTTFMLTPCHSLLFLFLSSIPSRVSA